jgi:hypothetical protein
VRPAIQQVLDAITDAPAWIRNGRHDHPGGEPDGAGACTRRCSPTTPAGEHARFVYLDPASQEFFADWERAADDIAAILRLEAGRNPHDKALTELIGELSTQSETFRTRWAAHNVRFHRHRQEEAAPPVVGDLDLDFEAMEFPSDPGLILLVYTAPAATPTATRSSCWPAGPPPRTSRPKSLLKTRNSCADPCPGPPPPKASPSGSPVTLWFDVIIRGEAPSRVRVNTVRFAPCARTAGTGTRPVRPCTSPTASAWSRPRWRVTVIRPGDVIYTPPGSGTGTAVLRTTSWSTPPSGRHRLRRTGDRVGRPRHRCGVRRNLPEHPGWNGRFTGGSQGS